MSQQLLYDVDERISAIKNSLKHITQNTENQAFIDLSDEKREKSLSLKSPKSPKSQKKQRKNTFVSNYVVFGNGEDSESSVDNETPPKKVTFDPASSNWYDQSMDLNTEVKKMEGKSDQMIEIELLLNYEKNKTASLEKKIQQKESEIEELNSKLVEINKNKENDKESYSELVNRLKNEILTLNKQIERYQELIKEFETFRYNKEKLLEEAEKNNLYEEKIDNLYKKNEELQQLVISKDSEIHYLENSNRELTRHNNHMEKYVEKCKEKLLKSSTDKKFQEEIKQLKQTNEALKEEIKKKPSDSALKDTEKKLRDLEKMVNDFCDKKSLQTDANKVSYRKIIGSLLNTLKINKFSEIVPKVQEIVKSSSVQNSQFPKKLRNLIMKYSPPDAFSKFPSDKKIYSWIKRLIEEYLMKLKEQEYYLRHFQVLTSAMKLLNITFPEDFLPKLEKILNKSNN